MSGAPETLAAPLPDGTVGVFTTRYGGVSDSPWAELNLARHVGDDLAAVAANRSAVADQLGGVRLVSLAQVHGSNVVVVDDRGDVLPAGGADALVTTHRGVALVVEVADCLPILIADPVGQVVAAVHAGRRGLAAGVLQNAVGAMRGLGARAADCVAVIGPGVCGSCYEVPETMRDEVAAVLPGSASATARGTPSLDLAAGATAVLLSLGIGEVRPTGICTMEDHRFYSHRRDGVTGRFAGVVMLARRG